MTFLEAKKALANELNIEYSKLNQNDRFSEKDLEAWINQGVKMIWDRHSWDFTEGQLEGTLSSAEISKGYLMYPDEMIVGSMQLLFLGDDEMDKIDFHDFRRIMKKEPKNQHEIFAEFKRNIYINPNLMKVGKDVEGYGKLGYETITDDTADVPFSTSSGIDSSGNDAIVSLAYAEALNSDKLREPEKANNEKQQAIGIVDRIWSNYADNRASETVVRPQFIVPDYFDDNTTPNSPQYRGKFDI